MKKAKQNFKIASILFLLIFSMSCGSDGDDGFTPVQPRTADDVREDYSNLVINTETNDLTLESIIAGQFWNFRVIVPEGASDTNKRPLIIRLHGGASANSPNAHKSTDCLVTPGFEGMDAYIVSPNSNGFLWYEEPNIVQVQALVDLVSSNEFIDTSKIVVMGYSDGGNGAWFFSQYFPQLFSAAIPMASSYATTSQSGVVHQFAKPLYVIHGSEDQLFPIETTQGYIDDSVAVGSDITFVTAEGLDHFNSCDYVSYLQEAATWLETTVWD